ncbi:hypothetical protein [Parvibaculum sp. MBR-TMA-1.3b-4.2]|jgi:hypothetical protein
MVFSMSGGGDLESCEGGTMKMVRALPDGGATVIVHHAAVRRYVERMIRDVKGGTVGRRERFRVVPIESPLGAEHALRGIGGAVRFDPAFWNRATPETQAAVLSFLPESPSIHLGEQADFIRTRRVL